MTEPSRPIVLRRLLYGRFVLENILHVEGFGAHLSLREKGRMPRHISIRCLFISAEIFERLLKFYLKSQ